MSYRKNLICSIALMIICSVLVSCAGTLNTKLDRDGNPIDESSESITSESETSETTSSTTTSETTTSTSESTTETSETSETSEPEDPTPTPIDPNNLPEYYNLVELGYTPPVENQSAYGSCQSETFTTIMESRLLVQGIQSDISEWAFFHCLNHYGFHYSYVGESSLIADGYAAIIPESAAPYPDDFVYGDRTEGYVLPDQYVNHQDYSVTDIYYLSDEYMSNDEIIEVAKTWLYRNYALGASFDFSEEAFDLYMSSDQQSYYCTDSHRTINHMMTIVGYDDNYPKENFKSTPSRDGAFLVQNSWGTDYWNGTGFFWISYDDAMMSDFDLFTVEVVSGDSYDYVDYYDVNAHWSDYTASLSSSSSTCGIKFHADNALDLDAVGIYTTVPNESFQVYLDVSGNMEQTVLVAEGTRQDRGFYRIELNDVYHIDAGTDYSFVIVYTGQVGEYLIPMDWIFTASAASDLTIGRTSGVTFVYMNGSWRDITSLGDQYGNICFKVYGHRS